MGKDSDKKIWMDYLEGNLSFEDFDEERFLREKDDLERVKLEGTVLDLHGYNANDSYLKLSDYIEKAYLCGISEIIVITGLGEKEDGSKGVLFEEVPKWLKYSRLSKFVKRFGYYSQTNRGALIVKIALD